MAGQPFASSSPREAIEHGIGMVYQEMLCLPNLSVSANIFCGREICRFGRLDEAEMRARTQAVLDRLSLRIDPDALAESLSAAHRQLLQVARALAFDCRILVLDEPTTALTDAEADHLFDVLRELKKARHDNPLRLASPARSVPAVRSHHRASRRRRWWTHSRQRT